MMKQRCLLTAFLLIVFACTRPCPIGGRCDRSCPSGMRALCAPNEVCVCAAGGANLQGGSPEPGCGPPSRGDLVLTEVLIDGEPTEREEFVELVNVSDEPVNIDGVALLSARGSKLGRRVLFTHGCFPARTTVAMYADPERWVWVPNHEEQVAFVELKRNHIL